MYRAVLGHEGPLCFPRAARQHCHQGVSRGVQGLSSTPGAWIQTRLRRGWGWGWGGGILCDICSNGKAVQSCLTCLAVADDHKMLEELSRNVAKLDESLKEAKKQEVNGKKGLRYLVCLWRASKQHPRRAASGA